MTQGASPPIDPALAAALDGFATRVEGNVSAAFEKRFAAFEARLKFVEGQVIPSTKPGGPPPEDGGAAAVATIPPIVLPNGLALNGSAPPPAGSSPTIAHRTDSLERKVNRLLKVHGVSPEEVSTLERVLRWVISPEGRKQLAALVAAVAATYAALRPVLTPPPPAAPLPAVVAPR
jgi:hypothetical protein